MYEDHRAQGVSHHGMEPLGFIKGLEHLVELGVIITEIIHDQNNSVSAAFRKLQEKYPDQLGKVGESNDVWHFFKNLSGK